MNSTCLRLSIRASADQRDLIDLAAARCGQSRSSFILESACSRAEEVLFGQNAMTQDAAFAESIFALLDRPPEPSDGLRRTLKAIAPWATPDLASAAGQRDG